MNVPKMSGWRISRRLLTLVAPLKGIMALAILSGSLGHLAAIAIPALGAWGIVRVIDGEPLWFAGFFALLIGLGLARALLHYGEQLANHYIAFKILAIIRDKVFRALRRLAPARMEEKDSGTLVSVITADIELLEVFYAHTISPVAIAIVVNGAMVGFFAYWHPAYALLALCCYLLLAIAVPLVTARWGKEAGRAQRADLSRLNNVILDSFRGIRECIQFAAGDRRVDMMDEATGRLRRSSRALADVSARNVGLSTAVVLVATMAFLSLATVLYRAGAVGQQGVLIPLIAFMSSFGPVLALSNLANNLLLTFACGERVLGLLDEEPVVDTVTNENILPLDRLAMVNVNFSYDNKTVLDNWSLGVRRGDVLGISGPSGCGKSTALKLMMRFYDPDAGEVRIDDVDLRTVDTSLLRSREAYMTQSTHLFNDSLRENVRIARLDASDAEVEEACRKAAIHEAILAFPDGYETVAGHLGDRLSAGERQRIGLARAFLHDGKLTLFDEPTANVDSLNEGMILKAIREEAREQAVVLVSHRPSTLRIADRLLKVETVRPS